MASSPAQLFKERPFTFSLIVVLLAFYAVEIAQSTPGFWIEGQGELPAIAQWGVVWSPAIVGGEWWRLVTAGFLHAGLLHIGLNVFALVIIGGAAERRFGWWMAAMIFLVAVIAGNSAALVLTPDAASLGASGGVMGLAGAVVVAGLMTGEGLAGSQWVISAIVMTLAFGFFNSGISTVAHIGGLLFGALVAVPMSMVLPRHSAPPRPARSVMPRGRREPVNQREVEFQRRIDAAVRRAAEERAREQAERQHELPPGQSGSG